MGWGCMFQPSNCASVFWWAPILELFREPQSPSRLSPHQHTKDTHHSHEFHGYCTRNWNKTRYLSVYDPGDTCKPQSTSLGCWEPMSLERVRTGPGLGGTCDVCLRRGLSRSWSRWFWSQWKIPSWVLILSFFLWSPLWGVMAFIFPEHLSTWSTITEN